MYVRRCPTFPPGLGSIIGADRLSFRVRDGTGRFPVAVTAVTLFTVTLFFWFVLVGGAAFHDKCVAGLNKWLRYVLVSFRPVSASSLHSLLSF